MLDYASTVDWSRAQFALTAIYHFMFVPLTLGLSFIIAFMNTFYYKTNDPKWGKATKFWMTLFAINFAIGVATGLIMEFEFGTNWSNYSWFVGDIFGAPLAAEGILAFFLESTFIAVMFFGWNRVSRKFHLVSTWLVAFGSNLSAYWILVANGWMQHPVGMTFNMDTLRNEMTSFADVALSPVAVSKFLHTIGGSYIVSALFVVGVSSYYLLKKRNIDIARRSIIVAATFGLIMSLAIVVTGDKSAYEVTQTQPVKLAAMEGLYDGSTAAPLVAFGILNPKKKIGDNQDPFIFEIKFPYLLSIMGTRSLNGFVPGINDLVYGNQEHGITPAKERIYHGKIAINALKEYNLNKKTDPSFAQIQKEIFFDNAKDMGYGYFNEPEEIVPNLIGLIFYSFHIMVTLSGWFILLFTVLIYIVLRKDITKFRLLQYASLWSIPLGYIAIQAGWIVAEVGRQPWAIQDLMPVRVAATNIASGNVKLSFILFAILFTILLIAEVKIMIRQIKIGPEGDKNV